MSVTPWTPGPWFADDGSGYGELNGWRIVLPDDGYVLAVAVGDVPELPVEANARLIADAPAMADQLAGILDAYESNGLGGDFGDGVSTDAIRAILARIKGETP